jgi:hypothetical protein
MRCTRYTKFAEWTRNDAIKWPDRFRGTHLHMRTLAPTTSLLTPGTNAQSTLMYGRRVSNAKGKAFIPPYTLGVRSTIQASNSAVSTIDDYERVKGPSFCTLQV